MSHTANKRVALATCTDLPGWEKDDASLHLALEGIGVSYEPLIKFGAFEQEHFSDVVIPSLSKQEMGLAGPWLRGILCTWHA